MQDIYYLLKKWDRGDLVIVCACLNRSSWINGCKLKTCMREASHGSQWAKSGSRATTIYDVCAQELAGKR
jgi:hypothetical protein